MAYTSPAAESFVPAAGPTGQCLAPLFSDLVQELAAIAVGEGNGTSANSWKYHQMRSTVHR